MKFVTKLSTLIAAVAMLASTAAFAAPKHGGKMIHVKATTRHMKSGKVVVVKGYTRHAAGKKKTVVVKGYDRKTKSGKIVHVKGYKRAKM